MVFPFLWSVLSSFKPPNEILTITPRLFPENPTLDNYRQVLAGGHFGRWYLNSLLVAAAVTISTCFFCSLAGYSLAKFRFAGKQVIFEAGQTTTVAGMFEVSGESGNLLGIVSTVDGIEAFLALNELEMGSFVSVKDNHAIPKFVILDAGSTIVGNATGWSFSIPTPALSWTGTGLLLAGLSTLGGFALLARRRAVNDRA